MSQVRENFINIIESLPYNLEEEIKRRDCFEIIKEITKKYVKVYGVEDLSKEDQNCILSIIGNA